MKTSNYVQLIGNLGNDPEFKTTSDKQNVCTFSVATHYRATDGAGNKETRTEWHRCVAFGSAAVLINKFLRKGSKAVFNGSLRTRHYEPDPGQVKYVTEIVVSDVLFLDTNQAQSDN